MYSYTNSYTNIFVFWLTSKIDHDRKFYYESSICNFFKSPITGSF
jgi:hypothetical protein